MLGQKKERKTLGYGNDSTTRLKNGTNFYSSSRESSVACAKTVIEGN